MRTRTLLTGLAVAVATAAPATATHGTIVCLLLTDAAGDANRVQPVPGGDSLDVVSADIATGPTQVKAVLRLRGAASADPATLAGARWAFGWTVGGTSYDFRYVTGVSAGATLHRAGDDGVPVTASFDEARREIRWTAPRALVPELGGTETLETLTGLHASTRAPAQAGVFADAGTTTRDYVENTRSCLKAV